MKVRPPPGLEKGCPSYGGALPLKVVVGHPGACSNFDFSGSFDEALPLPVSRGASSGCAGSDLGESSAAETKSEGSQECAFQGMSRTRRRRNQRKKLKLLYQFAPAEKRDDGSVVISL
jgi:hypothetical protein